VTGRWVGGGGCPVSGGGHFRSRPASHSGAGDRCRNDRGRVFRKRVSQPKLPSKPPKVQEPLVVLHPSTWPLQQLADGARDLGHSETRELPRNLAHRLQVAGAERASAEGQEFGHAREEGRGRPAPGTMSRITAHGARSNLTQRVKASLSCSRQVRRTDQDLWGSRSFPGPVPTPHFAGDRHAADGPLRCGGFKVTFCGRSKSARPMLRVCLSYLPSTA